MKYRTTAAVIASAIAVSVTLTPARAADGLVTIEGMQVLPGEITPGVGQVLTPFSSLAQPGDLGRRAHTHYKIFKTFQPLTVSPAKAGPAQFLSSNADWNTPASAACIYGLVSPTRGCDPRKVTTDATGGSQAIAIVDAFHDPTALQDLQTFSTLMGLPSPDLEVIYCSSTRCGVRKPPPFCQTSDECGWIGEISLDVQWAHAMAPQAKIILVEANSDSFADLILAEDAAATAVARAGGGEVSNSWGGSDAFDHTADDSHFVRRGVVFFASTGDHKCGSSCADVEWPSTSPNVVAVGGTTIVRSATGAFRSQTAWIDGGGGLSAHETRPRFQRNVRRKVGNARGVPDISLFADPNTGAFVMCTATNMPGCDTSGSQIFVYGGTSLASPATAAMVNNAGAFRASSAVQNTFLYGGLGGANFTDIRAGQCNNGSGGALVNAVAGWDVCTGIGTPKGKSGL